MANSMQIAYKLQIEMQFANKVGTIYPPPCRQYLINFLDGIQVATVHIFLFCFAWPHAYLIHFFAGLQIANCDAVLQLQSEF